MRENELLKSELSKTKSLLEDVNLKFQKTKSTLKEYVRTAKAAEASKRRDKNNSPRSSVASPLFLGKSSSSKGVRECPLFPDLVQRYDQFDTSSKVDTFLNISHMQTANSKIIVPVLDQYFFT